MRFAHLLDNVLEKAGKREVLYFLELGPWGEVTSLSVILIVR
jgi:hypothetical protein